MMIGKKSIILLIVYLNFMFAQDEMKILIVPANINYQKSELEFVSKIFYDLFLDTIAVSNSKRQLEGKELFIIKDLVTPNKIYHRKIRKFHSLLKNENFLDDIMDKYELSSVLWYDFPSSILNKSGKIKKNFKFKFCLKSIESDKTICKNQNVSFDNKLFFLKKKSFKDVKKKIELSLNDI